jgi:hypothetical protein
MTKAKEQKEKVTNEKPVSLYPLSLKEALEALLQIKPKAKGEKQKKSRKKQESKKSSD